MQKISSILQISKGIGSWVEDNGSAAAAPSVVLGVVAQLQIDLRQPLPPDAETGALPAYPISELEGLGLIFVLDVDWDQRTLPPLVTSQGISLNQDEDGHTILTIQLPNTNTEALRQKIGTAETITFRAELIGRDANSRDAFATAFKIIFRNRVYLGDAEQAPDVTDPDWLPTVRANIQEIVDGMAADLKGDTGDAGADGADGKSAYDIWLEEGHEGTEADFLASLKGDTGETGPAGSLTAGTATALPAGSAPTVSIVNGALNLGIPAGETGPAGADANVILYAFNTTSAPDAADWHSEMTPYDLYWRYSADDGATWSAAKPLSQPPVAPLCRFSKVAQTVNPTWTALEEGDDYSEVPANSAYFRVKLASYPWTEPRCIANPPDTATEEEIAAMENLLRQSEIRAQFLNGTDASDEWHAAPQPGDNKIRFFNTTGTILYDWTLEYDAPVIEAVECSPTGPQWHDLPQADDKYMKISIDGGTSWYGYFKIAVDDAEIPDLSNYATIAYAQALAATRIANSARGAANGVAPLDSSGKVPDDFLPAGHGSTITVDNAINAASENPVQNKVIAQALAGKAAASHTHAQSNISGLSDALAAKLTAPSGGSAGQVLTKTANGSEWATPSGGSPLTDVTACATDVVAVPGGVYEATGTGAVSLGGGWTAGKSAVAKIYIRSTATLTVSAGISYDAADDAPAPGVGWIDWDGTAARFYMGCYDAGEGSSSSSSQTA